MKSIKKILFSIASVFTCAIGITPTSPKTLYTGISYGPFEGDSDAEVYIYNWEENVNYTVKLEHFYVNTNVRYAVCTGVVATKNSSNVIPVVFVGEGRMDKGGVRLKFTFSNGKSYEITVKKPEHSQINASRYKEEDIVINNRVIFMAALGFFSYETISFKNTNEYLSTDKYNAISFGELFFNHSYYIESTYSSAYLKIYDTENIYPNLTKGTGSNIVKVPLSLSQNDKVVTFTPNAKLYVKPDTLQMYKSHYRGTNPTKNIYVPIGKEKKMENNEMEIVIEDYGADKSIITIPLIFYDYRSMFGLCHDSDYCITGGVKK